MMNGDEFLRTLKWIAVGVLLALLTSVAVNGSLADDSADEKYLTIVQSKFERSADGLREATNGKELLPIADDELNKETVILSDEFSVTDKNERTVNVDFSFEAEMYTAENVLDHIVLVTNSGNVTGYVRTWFAFEMGDLTEAEFESSVLINRNTDEWSWADFEYGVIIGGNRYAVVCAEHNGSLNAGETSSPSLLQILLHSGVDNAIVQRLDGNSDFQYDVIAHSQTVSDDDAWSRVVCPWELN